MELGRSLPASTPHASAGLGWLLRLKAAIIRNRLSQLVNQSPVKLLLVILFIGVIWAALYFVFDEAFRFMRRFEQPAAIAIPYVFHVFFVAMTALLAFSTAILSYGALFGRPEPSFLLATPNPPRHVVSVMYLESLFFASWSFILLGIPLMAAFGEVQNLPWYFYAVFAVAFLGFVPIPGAVGLLVALVVALWLPKQARRMLIYAASAAIILLVVWWSRLWVAASESSGVWLHSFLGELQYLKAALLPSTWVANSIRAAVEDKPADAAFYLFVTLATGLFFSWAAINIAGAKLLVAFGRAHLITHRARIRSGRLSRWFTRIAFFYAPPEMQALILKDVRTFLRDPSQWSQLAILFGLLGLYLLYLPRSRPAGFDLPWTGLICFLNYGAVTLILSTFTSRFVFPMISMEGRQMWLVALWPLPRRQAVWAKFFYAITITVFAAMIVTALSIRALNLSFALAAVQVCATLATCVGLCGLAVGLGARLPNYRETNPGRIASGLGGTLNLIVSVMLVAVTIVLFGVVCYNLVSTGDLNQLERTDLLVAAAIVGLGLATAVISMTVGVRAFRRQEF
jgi:ABC-2 type transport system permease protein